MSKRFTYVVRPLEHLYAMDHTAINMPYSHANWSSRNVKVDQHRIKKRWGYLADRDLGDGTNTQHIAIYQKFDKTRHTLYLTTTDLARKETSGSNTWSYKTESYTTGTISSISGTTVTGSGTSWNSSGLDDGDKFIVNSDHSSLVELDTHWATIDAITDDTHLELKANYTGAGSSGNYITRLVYSTPANERWTYAVVDDKFCFTNGNTDVMYWDGSNYASALDSTNAKKARYCIEYANRLVLADMELSSVREPWTVKWSKENDPTDWTDTTAGESDLKETEDFITGLGKVADKLVIYRQDSVHFGYRTGKSTSPIAIPVQKMGIGCIAPYSIVHVRGANMFLGRDDFYMIEGQQPVPIGEKIKYKLFDITGKTELENMWGAVNSFENQVLWFANTDEGQRVFVLDYIDMEWGHYEFWDFITGMGSGAL